MIKDKIIFAIEDHLQGNETGIDGQIEATEDIINIIEMELFDKELAKARTRLPFFSSPEEYWMTQGRIKLLKEFKEKLHT